MTDAAQLLASLGIEPGVNTFRPISNVVSMSDYRHDTTYQDIVTPLLGVTTTFSLILLAYIGFKFKRICLQYVSDRFEYLLSNRSDLIYQIEYRMFVGDELHSSTVLSRYTTGRLDETPLLTAEECAARGELDCVIVV